ncbi:MAG: hypothetical protein ACP5QG_09350, partial [candidate division WOR-3 bacterium]
DHEEHPCQGDLCGHISLQEKGGNRAEKAHQETQEGQVRNINADKLIDYIEGHPESEQGFDPQSKKEALRKIQAQKDKLYLLLLEEGIRVPDLKERIRAEYEDLTEREAILTREIEAFERNEAERLSLKERMISAIEYAWELGQATEYLSQDERGEIMSLLLDEVLLEDKGDHG